jgi:hypothetical protein
MAVNYSKPRLPPKDPTPSELSQLKSYAHRIAVLRLGPGDPRVAQMAAQIVHRALLYGK